jgi:uncharacterized protein (TIGR02246 family)
MTLTTKDLLEIQNLYARYCHTVDARDGEAWAACFTRDGSLVPSTGWGAGRTIRGREALAAYGAEAARHNASRHWITNLMLDEHGDHVRGACYGQLIDVSGQAPRPMAHVIYEDVLVHEDGRWLFAARRPRRDV